MDSVLRDRSHIDETLRLAAEENAGSYAGEEKALWLHIRACFKHTDPQTLTANLVS